MTGEALHEAGITVSATMSASHIGIDTVVETRDGRLGQNGLGKDLPNFHIQYYNGGERKSKVLPPSSPPPAGDCVAINQKLLPPQHGTGGRVMKL
jgi:hypothetical protein